MQSSNLESKALSNDDISIPCGHNINKGWEHRAHFVPLQLGAHVISISLQSPALQTVIKAAIYEITGNALFSTAYPSAIIVADYFCDTLRAIADNLNISVLGHHFGKDCRFVETISCIVSPPMSILLLFLIFDHSWLSICWTWKNWLQWRWNVMIHPNFSHPCQTPSLSPYPCLSGHYH